MCPLGGPVWNGRRPGSTASTPFDAANQIRPSLTLDAGGLKPIGVAKLRTPSEPSSRVGFTERLGSATHAASSAERTRTNPHGVNNHTAPSPSAIVQCTPSHGSPFAVVSVATRLLSIRLRPPAVAPHNRPSESNCNCETRPEPSPLAARYDSRVVPPCTSATPPL